MGIINSAQDGFSEEQSEDSIVLQIVGDIVHETRGSGNSITPDGEPDPEEESDEDDDQQNNMPPPNPMPEGTEQETQRWNQHDFQPGMSAHADTEDPEPGQVEGVPDQESGELDMDEHWRKVSARTGIY